MSNNLDELIKQIEAAESDREVCLDGSVLCTSDDLKALTARVQHLEAALRKIADRNAHGVMVTIARKALEETNE